MNLANKVFKFLQSSGLVEAESRAWISPEGLAKWYRSVSASPDARQNYAELHNFMKNKKSGIVIGELGKKHVEVTFGSKRYSRIPGYVFTREPPKSDDK